MKKIFLSACVIAVFIGYGIFERLTGITNKNVPISQTNQTGNLSVQSQNAHYKNGNFTGNPADAFYGTIQVQVVIQSGKITDVQFLQYPSDRSRSVSINTYAMPLLKQEAIQTQSANVNIVSGASDSSQAFVQSLQSALSQATM